MHPHQKAFPAIFISLISLALIFFGATLSGGAAANAAGTSAGTVSLSSTINGAVENLGVKLIGVARTGGSSGAASVLCRTADGTAKAGIDYTAVSQVLNWASGDMTEKYCHVTLSDAHPFSGQRTFFVGLSAATGAALGTSSSTVTIYGNEAVGHIALSAPTYTVAQNAGSVTITVDRAGGSSGWAAVAYATANGTAIAGTDYASERGVVRWAGGDMTPKTFTIPISKAKPFTGTKTLAVAVAGAQGAILGSVNSRAIVTINGEATATTGIATLSWTAPTHDTNGSPITDLAGYNLHYGKTSTTMTNVIAVNDPASASYVIRNLAPGTWYFAVVAYNTQAVESTFSNVVSKTI
jgi:Calx-beta domain/Fibronectin type III domain